MVRKKKWSGILRDILARIKASPQLIKDDKDDLVMDSEIKNDLSTKVPVEDFFSKMD